MYFKELNKVKDMMFRIDEDYRRYAYATALNEDKRGKAAKKGCYKVLRDFFHNASWLDNEFVDESNPDHLSVIDFIYVHFMEEFYHDDAVRAGATMRLAPLFMRLALEAGYQQGTDDPITMNHLMGLLNYLHRLNKEKGFDLNKISLDSTYEDLDEFSKELDKQRSDMKKHIKNGKYDENNDLNGYEIHGPLTYEEGRVYGLKSCPDSLLCYAQKRSTWNQGNYANNGHNTAYVLLKNGWEDIPPEHDDESNSAYDTYGMSMIFVFVNGKGDLVCCNTRWNHRARYKSDRSVDHALDEMDITKLIGRNFYKMFKPAD